MKTKIPLILLVASLVLSACTGNIPQVQAESTDDAVSVSEEESTSEVSSSDANSSDENSEVDNEITRPEGWSEETHGNDVDPDYETVFPEDQVNQITITIDPEDWEAMQANMVDIYGEAGTGQTNNRDGAAQDQPAAGNRPNPGNNAPQQDNQQQQPAAQEGNRPNNGGGMPSENPTWVSATVEFDGNVWTNVGVRYKGNSSLKQGWSSGSDKLPLKLDFDEFEDEYPEIENQRFYGFKQLSLANGFSDASFLRDAVTSDILEDAGLPSAKTAFYEVYIDYGEGPQLLGLYTMIEVIDDTAIDRYFGSDDGNIYEADGFGASLSTTTYGQIETSFEKENNEDSDWSDIQNLYEVLHSDLRTSDPEAWREELESVFDTDAFLEWLAIAAVIQHWDTYGSMSHNFYLYNDPETGQLTFISWDHNQAMSQSAGGGGRDGGINRTVTLDKEDIGENWPLIRFLLDDPVYYEQYLSYLQETIEEAFNPDLMAEKYQNMADLIEPYAIADVGEQAFTTAVQTLIQHAYDRSDTVTEFLASVGYE